MKHKRSATQLDYQPHEDAQAGVCFYCSAPADTKDHVPAVSCVHAVGADQFKDFYVVPACRECNSALGDKWLNTTQDRALFLQTWYRDRYQAALSTPDWSAEELKVLRNTSLHKQVEMGLALRDLIRAKLEHLVLRS